jgi:hypothetical protein
MKLFIRSTVCLMRKKTKLSNLDVFPPPSVHLCPSKKSPSW